MQDSCCILVYKVFSDTVFIKPRHLLTSFSVLWPPTPRADLSSTRFTHLPGKEPSSVSGVAPHGDSVAWTFCATFTCSGTTPERKEKLNGQALEKDRSQDTSKDVDSRDEGSEAHGQEATFSTWFPGTQRIWHVGGEGTFSFH